MSIEAMKQALEALEECAVMIDGEWGICRSLAEMDETDCLPQNVRGPITALRTAIEAAEKQEPVALGDEWTPCMKLPIVVHVRQQRQGESHVSTREGITPVKPDDLIMRGVSGEEYPIGRSIFEQTYTIDTTPPAAQPAPVHDQLAWQNLRNRIQADINGTDGRWGMHGHSAVDNDYFIALEWVVERMDEILASAHRQPLIDVQWLEDAYLAGFMNSDEGHNGEYPFRYREENPLEDRRWVAAKNAYISAAIAAAKGEA